MKNTIYKYLKICLHDWKTVGGQQTPLSYSKLEECQICGKGKTFYMSGCAHTYSTMTKAEMSKWREDCKNSA